MKATMEKSELKRFLVMDMAERLIRVEQNVSSSFNQEVPYNKTSYYLSMTPEQRKDFDHFLKNKKKKRLAMLALFFISLICMSLFGSGLTGSAIYDGENIHSFSYFQGVYFLVSLVLFAYTCYYFISGNLKHRKFEEHAGIIENMLLGKKFPK